MNVKSGSEFDLDFAMFAIPLPLNLILILVSVIDDVVMTVYDFRVSRSDYLPHLRDYLLMIDAMMDQD
jgi:hypothetical protein